MAKKENRLYFDSPVFEENGYIGEEHTCDGYERSPPFYIAQVPPETKSFVLLMEDLDAEDSQGESSRNHWVVWNIPVVEEIEEQELPHGAVVGVNDFGDNAYAGPCPHNSEHRYEFRLYAINKVLNLDEDSSKKVVLASIEYDILAQSSICCRYKREEHDNDEYTIMQK